ncbi:hypothetical protein BH23CHL5_BH23CHL5_10650 [soil metagenome]
MATSRAPLNVTGESVYPVSPLSTSNSDPSESGVNPGVSDSARLFLERARVMNPGFNINA